MTKASILGVSIDVNDRPGLPLELEALIVPLCSELPSEELA